jgi:DNA invertase Pin-like site-specific DNA recombinase
LNICELCLDNNTRLIAINDRVDTAVDGWQDSAFISAWHHERSNRDTSNRIRRSLRNRFTQGGVFQFEIYGYIKPENAKSDADVCKDPKAEPIYDQWFKMLEEGATYAEVADWLNAQNVPTGPFCDLPRWNGSMVGRITQNPILKGVRERNHKIAKRVNKTGRHRSVKAPPEDLLRRPCPHLAFIEPERYDRVIRLLTERNKKYRRIGINGVDPRRDVPKKRTVWPGQHLVCGICGRLMNYGAHGQNTHLFCAGAYDYRCWNAISVDGPLAAGKLIEAVRRELMLLPDFDEALLADVRAEFEQSRFRNNHRLREVQDRLRQIERELQNVLATVRAVGHSQSLIDDLKHIEAEQSDLREEERTLRRGSLNDLVLPSRDELRTRVLKALDSLAHESQEFSRLMRAWIPRIAVVPVKPCLGGRPVPRAYLHFDLTPLLPWQMNGDAPGSVFRRNVCVDLFNLPQREALRPQIVELTRKGIAQREIARQLGIHLPVVQRAMALQRRMDELGITDPFVHITTPPPDDNRWRRHRHQRFRADSLNGYPIPEILGQS